MRALVMVAHPDDCVIFAYSFIQKYCVHDYTVCYLTYTPDQERAVELTKFWQKRNVSVEFLGFVDDWKSVQNGLLGFDEQLATQAITVAIEPFDFVITHNADGDYGHVHHKFVHGVVMQNHAHVITFQAPNHGNETITVDRPDFGPQDLPQHYDVIAGFHADLHMNSYHIPERTRKLVDQHG